jgi:hypothetical protein
MDDPNLTPEQNTFRGVYIDLMVEIKDRVNVIERAVNRRYVELPAFAAHDLCHVQLRLICELIAMGCLIAHGDIEATQSSKLQKEWQPSKILSALEALHPSFYPRPVRRDLDAQFQAMRLHDVTSGFLTKEDLIKLWDKCGSHLHRGTIKSLMSINDAYTSSDMNEIGGWVQKIVSLLREHVIVHLDVGKAFMIVMDDVGGKPRGYSLTVAPNPPPPRHSQS